MFKVLMEANDDPESWYSMPISSKRLISEVGSIPEDFDENEIGYDMELIHLRSSGSKTLIRWCRDNIKGKYRIEHGMPTTVYVKDSNEFFIFKLRWS